MKDAIENKVLCSFKKEEPKKLSKILMFFTGIAFVLLFLTVNYIKDSIIHKRLTEDLVLALFILSGTMYFIL